VTASSERPAIDGRDLAIAALVRAKQLLADLDTRARDSDVHTVRAGVAHEVSTALSALQAGAVGDRDAKLRRDAAGTSRAAAKRVKVKTGNQRGQILIALERVTSYAGTGGLTDYELSRLLGIPPNSLRPRRGELADQQYIEPVPGVTAGTVLTRKHNGNDWQIWRTTPVGKALAQSLVRETGQRGHRLPPPDDGQQVLA